MLAARARDGTLWLRQVTDRALLGTLRGHTGLITSVAFSPDGRALVSTSWEDAMFLWSVVP
jgi:WD40 repeat protein